MTLTGLLLREIIPLCKPTRTLQELKQAMAEVNVCAENFGIHHERLVDQELCGNDKSPSLEVRAAVICGVNGTARHRGPDTCFVILEGKGKIQAKKSL